MTKLELYFEKNKLYLTTYTKRKGDSSEERIVITKAQALTLADAIQVKWPK